MGAILPPLLLLALAATAGASPRVVVQPHLQAAARLASRPPLWTRERSAALGDWATFDNTSDALNMFITTPLWRLQLRKASCSIMSLTDAASGALLVGGNPGGTWTFTNETGGVVSSTRQSHVHYSWLGGEPAVLAMAWRPLATDGYMPSVDVNISITSGQRYFDLSFQLAEPHSDTATTYDGVWWPSLTFNASSVETVFFPQLPGLLLNSSWFTTRPGSAGQTVPYPGGVIHRFGISIMWRYRHDTYGANVTAGCDPANGGWPNAPAAAPAGVAAAAPPCALGVGGTMRTRIAVGGAVADDVVLYGVSNGLLTGGSAGSGSGIGSSRVSGAAAAEGGENNGEGEGHTVATMLPLASTAAQHLVPFSSTAGPLPALSTKLPLPLLQQWARAPLYKLDTREANLNFSAYASTIYPLLPVPGNVHFMAFEPVAFDHYYPDYLPPDPRFGTGCDLEAAFQAALDAGHLTMPYTNPTWWDPAAPTLADLPPPLTLRDVTAWNASRETIYETYPDVPPATGVVTALTHPYVYGRWGRLMCQLSYNATGCEAWYPGAGGGASAGAAYTYPSLTSAAGTTAAVCNESAVRLPSSLIFEDQVGARHAYPDTQGLQSGMGALGFQRGMEAQASNFSGVGLGTEQGYDKVARYVSGFYGNNLEVANNAGGGSYPWGYNSSWTPHPVSQMLVGPSVAYQVHNLATSAFARSLENACWILASGGRLSIDVAQAHYWSSAEQAWYRSVGLMQRHVVSRYLGYQQVGYDDVSPTGEPLTVGTGAAVTTMAVVVGIPPLFPGSSISYSIVTNWAAVDTLDVQLQLPWSVTAAGGGKGRGKDGQSSTSGPLLFTLPATGCMAYGGDGDAVGGWYTVYNNRTLPLPAPSSGLPPYHGIVEDRLCGWVPPAEGTTGSGSGRAHSVSAPSAAQGETVCVYHPLGPDTDLDVVAPSGCSGSGSTVAVTAVGVGGASLGPVHASYNSASGLVTFPATASVGGAAVDYFAISC